MPPGLSHGPDLAPQSAVSIFAVSFHQLDDAVTKRWLGESCASTRLLGDEEDRKRKIAELFVSDEPLVCSKHR